MAIPVLNGFVEKSCRGVHSHSNGDKTSFHLESNIMMTLKLDMKHICKKEVGEGVLWTWCLGGRRGALHGHRTAGSSELLWGGDPNVGPGLLLDDQLDFVVDLL